MKPLRFTEEDSSRANELWGANCGPHALAAALGLTLGEAREVLPTFEDKGYTNPTMMLTALVLARAKFTVAKNLRSAELCDGLNRIQWEGRWTKPGVPPRVAYGYTHWVARSAGGVFCTCMPWRVWTPEDTWRQMIADMCRTEGFDGWHVTHHYALTKEGE